MCMCAYERMQMMHKRTNARMRAHTSIFLSLLLMHTHSFFRTQLAPHRVWVMRRDLHVWKETYKHEKRHVHTKRDKWRRPIKETFLSLLCTHTHTLSLSLSLSLARSERAHRERVMKETHTYGKRRIHSERDMWKRPINKTVLSLAHTHTVSPSRDVCVHEKVREQMRVCVCVHICPNLHVWVCMTVCLYMGRLRLVGSLKL